jgi:hypothetical protein
MTEHELQVQVMREWCEHCGDELRREHINVSKCVALCSKCGGLRAEDERWSSDTAARCFCD